MSNVGQKKNSPPPNNKEKIYALQKRNIVCNISPSCQILLWNRNIVQLHHGITIWKLWNSYQNIHEYLIIFYNTLDKHQCICLSSTYKYNIISIKALNPLHVGEHPYRRRRKGLITAAAKPTVLLTFHGPSRMSLLLHRTKLVLPWRCLHRH